MSAALGVMLAVVTTAAQMAPSGGYAGGADSAFPDTGNDVRMHSVLVPQGFAAPRSLPFEFVRPEVIRIRSEFAFEASKSLLDWLSADVVTMSALSVSRGERVDAGVQLAGTPVHLNTRTRAVITTVSFHQPISEHLGVYGRVGAARTSTHTLVRDTLSAVGLGETLRDTTTRPWVGFGIRWERKLSISGEYGGASDEFHSARLVVDWTF